MFFKKKLKENILNKKWLKNSNFELQRQIFHHEIAYKACGDRNVVSPINNSDIILNLGAGYGIWSYKICQDYNMNCVVNVDIKKFDIYENTQEIDYIENYYELNIIFKKIDLKKELINFRNSTIDFIYQRDMISIYNNFEWENIIKEIHRVLKPESYVELVEYNFIINHKKNIHNNFSNFINTYLINIFNNNNYIYQPILLEKMVKTYFKNVNTKIVKLPLYSEHIFEGICIEDLIIGYKHMKDEIEKYFSTGFDKFVNELKKEWIDNQSYIELYIIYAQKY